MLHANITAAAVAPSSREELDADYPKGVARDRHDQRRALQVPGLTAGAQSAIQATLVAYDAAEALNSVFRTLDAQHTDNLADVALARRRDRAEDRWSRARAAALKAAEKVLTVPAATAAETAAQFNAFMLLTYVPNTNPRHRKSFTIERAVEAMFEEDAKHVLVQALRAISSAPTQSAAAIDRSAWDAAMAEFERAFAEYSAWDEAEDGRRDALYREIFGENLEQFTERVWTATAGRSRLWFRYPDTDALAVALPTMSAADRTALCAAIQEMGPGLRAIEEEFDPKHQEELSDRWFEALEALDALPAPDLPALAFKMRQELALEFSCHPWQLDTEEEMVKQLTLQCGADRLRFTWYQDVLRLAGVTGPHVDAKPWDPAPWVAAFRAAGGELRLQNCVGDGPLGKCVSFRVEPANEAACAPLMDQVRGWKNEAIAAFVVSEQRDADADAKKRLEQIAEVNARWDSARASHIAGQHVGANLIAAE